MKQANGGLLFESFERSVFGAAQHVVKDEDRYLVEEVQLAGERIILVLLADGHGGAEASHIVADAMLQQFQSCAPNGSFENLNSTIVAAFGVVHRLVRASGSTSGSTLTIVCLNMTRREVSVWNVGDSLVLLLDNEHQVQLGESHSLDNNPAECARVLAAGARIEQTKGSDGRPNGPLRAFPGGLAVTRAIGDADCGDYVIPDPTCTRRLMPASGIAIVVASNSVWRRLTADRVSRVLRKSDCEGVLSATTAAQELVRITTECAPHRGDATAVVLLIDECCSKDGRQRLARARAARDAAHMPQAHSEPGAHMNNARFLGPHPRSALRGACECVAPVALANADSWTVHDGIALIHDLRQGAGHTPCTQKLLQQSREREPLMSAARLLRSWRLLGDFSNLRSLHRSPGQARRGRGSGTGRPAEAAAEPGTCAGGSCGMALQTDAVQQRKEAVVRGVGAAKVATALRGGNRIPALAWIEVTPADGLDCRVDSDANTLLHCACAVDSVVVVERLVQAGASRELPARGGNLPLHVACEQGHVLCAQVLLDVGCAPDAVNNYQQTALMLAAARGKLDAVNLLLAHGARTDLRDEAGMTPSMIAMSFRRSAITMVFKRHIKETARNQRTASRREPAGMDSLATAEAPEPRANWSGLADNLRLDALLWRPRARGAWSRD